MAKKYGLPYRGSKNTIARWVVEHLPDADTLVDLFCGGCAVTHAALESGRFRRVIANDIQGDVPALFLAAAQGQYTTQTRPEWISREDFFAHKDADAYVRYCWSFGCGGEDYLYAREIEPFKRRVHELIFGTTVSARHAAWRAFVREYDRLSADIDRLRADALRLCEAYGVEMARRPDGGIDAAQTKADVMRVLTADIREHLRAALKSSGRTAADVDRLLGTNGMAGHYFGASQWVLPTEEAYEKMRTILQGLTVPWGELAGKLEKIKRLETLQSLQSLQRLQRLQSLQRLQRLEELKSPEGLERLETSGLDYRAVTIPAGAVIYCDIPYQSTVGDCYGTQFDRAAFLDWADAQEQPVIISEYNIDDARFEVLAERAKRQLMAGAKHQKKVVERLYVPKRQADEMRRRLAAREELDGQMQMEW